jgi:hypothetical protein
VPSVVSTPGWHLIANRIRQHDRRATAPEVANGAFEPQTAVHGEPREVNPFGGAYQFDPFAATDSRPQPDESPNAPSLRTTWSHAFGKGQAQTSHRRWLVLNSLLGWSWADPIAALAVAAIAVREGVQA